MSETQAQKSQPVFLSARWVHLALVSFEIAPNILKPYIPVGTTPDFYEGKTYVSLVAFLFEDTRAFGLIPALFHQDFEEINLRFYVTRKETGHTKRGVVFIKEIVPKSFLAWLARTVYRENYVTLPTSHHITQGSSYEYRWGDSRLRVNASGKQLEAPADSFERWITEHYWGYTRVSAEKTLEYEVKHPVWHLYEVTDHHLEVEGALYGSEFQPYVKGKPSSVILAQGSTVSVHWPTAIRVRERG